MISLLAEVTPKLSWYISRSSGIVSWILMSASVIWGLLLSARILNRHTAPGWLLDLHRYLGAASIVFVGVHLLGLVGDNWAHYGWTELFVPMTSKLGSHYKVPVAWGVVSFYLLVAIEITSLLKSRIPRKLWKSTHYLSFPLFVMTTIHGLTAGTDRHVKFFEWLAVISVTLFIVQLMMRIVATRTSSRDRARSAVNV